MWGRLTAPFLDRYHRWILWSPVFVATGVGWYFYLNREPLLVFGVMAVLAGLAALILLKENLPARIIIVIALCVATGFTASTLRTLTGGTPMLKGETGLVTITGKVESIDHAPSSARIVLENVTIEDIPPNKTPHRLRVKLAGKFGVPHMGEEISVLGALMPPSPPVAPRSYDFQRHMFFQRIGGTGYAVRQFEVLKSAPHRNLTAETLRESINARILEAKGDSVSKAILIAFLTGERHLIPEKVWQDVRHSGLAHLIAISGLHISLIAAFVFFILRAVLAAIPYAALYWPIKKISALMAFAVIVFYCWLIGSPVSAERAVIMTGVVLFAVLIDRVAISLRLAAFAAAFILLTTPEMLFTPGFQMSFAAVVALIAFYESWRYGFGAGLYRHGRLYRAAAYFLATLATTVIATLATAPFALFHFQRVPLLPGIFANMIAVPLTSLVTMPFGFIAMLLMPFGFEELFLRVALWSVDIVLKIAATASSMPGAGMVAPVWPIEALVVIVLGGLWLAIWQGRLRLWGLLIMLLGIFMTQNVERPDILFTDEGKVIAIHNGESPGIFAVSSKRAERFARETWRDRYGGAEEVSWPENGGLEGFPLRCDMGGCVYRHDTNLIVAFPRNEMAAYKDCIKAGLIVAPRFYDLPAICRDKNVISRQDLKKRGSHAIYFTADGGYRIETARDVRGLRPWTQYRD